MASTAVGPELEALTLAYDDAITRERFVSCAATDGHLRLTHVASFVQGFPEAEAILR